MHRWHGNSHTATNHQFDNYFVEWYLLVLQKIWLRLVDDYLICVSTFIRFRLSKHLLAHKHEHRSWEFHDTLRFYGPYRHVHEHKDWGYLESPVEQKFSVFVCMVGKARKNAAYLGVSWNSHHPCLCKLSPYSNVCAMLTNTEIFWVVLCGSIRSDVSESYHVAQISWDPCSCVCSDKEEPNNN
jgi:hypothetical protein